MNVNYERKLKVFCFMLLDDRISVTGATGQSEKTGFYSFKYGLNKHQRIYKLNLQTKE